MVYGGHVPPGGLSWTFQLILCILLGACGLSDPHPAESQHHGPEAEWGLGRPNLTDKGTRQEPDRGRLPVLCKPVTPRCKNFLDRLQGASRCRLNIRLLGAEALQMQNLCAALCEDWLVSCGNDVACSPTWLPILRRRLCAPSCTTSRQMMPPGSQRCPKSFSPAPPGHSQLRMRGSSLARSRRRARTWILDPAGSGSGNGSGSGSGH